MRKVSIEHKRRVRHLVYVRFKTRHPNAYKEYRDNNKEHRAAKERERYAKNKETIRNQQREYYDKTKEKKCISSRKYHWQNREKRNKQAAERRHRRFRNDRFGLGGIDNVGVSGHTLLNARRPTAKTKRSGSRPQ